MLIFHYKHFGFDGGSSFDALLLPFGSALGLIYEFGLFAVEVFFCMSGFLFFTLYEKRIAKDATINRRLSFFDFFTSRFARLYPVYLITLVVALLLLLTTKALYGAPFVYQDLSGLEVLKSVFLVQQWFIGAKQSLNGPGWSISVEWFLYGLFFLVAYFGVARPVHLLGLILIGLLLQALLSAYFPDFLRGIPAFFAGGLMAYAYVVLKKSPKRRTFIILGALTLSSLVLALIGGILSLRGHVFDGISAVIFSRQSLSLIVIPVSVLWLAHKGRESFLGSKPFVWLGEISYSLYLWHFPLQCALMIGLSSLTSSARLSLFSHPFMMFFYFGLCIAIGALSYYLLERPSQKALNSLFKRFHKI